jgi:hypothetical protein
MLVHRLEFSAEDLGDNASRLQELSRSCSNLRAVPQGHVALVIAAVKEQLAHALSIITRLQCDDDMPKRIKDPKLCGYWRRLVLGRH